MTANLDFALRNKLRWDSPKGPLSIEELWELPLTSATGTRANLDDIAVALHKSLESGTTVSFVNTEAKPDETARIKFDIVKHIIDVKVEERKAAATARENAEKKQRIMAIIAERQEQDLKNLPMEELTKLLAGL